VVDLVKMLKEHEGVRRFPYKDTVGKLTIGVGFNLTDVGLYPEEIDFILKNRLEKLARSLEQHLPWADSLDAVRLAVLMDMAYNLGVGGLLAFKNTLAYIKAGNYTAAALNMVKSKWAKQVGRRATVLAEMMRTGRMPHGLA